MPKSWIEHFSYTYSPIPGGAFYTKLWARRRTRFLRVEDKNSDIKKNLKVLGSPPGPGISKLSNQLSGFCLKLFLIFFRQTKKTTDACRLKFSNPTTTDEKTVLNLMPHSKSSKSKQSTKNQPEEQKTKHYLMQELATR